MAVLSFLLVSLVSILPFYAKGANLPGLNVVLRNKVNISQSLKVSIAPQREYKGMIPDVCLQILVDKKAGDVRTLVNREDVRVPPTLGLQLIPSNNDRTSNLDITFNSSEAGLFDDPVNVTVSIFQLDDGSECKTDEDLLIANDTSLLYDDRGTYIFNFN